MVMLIAHISVGAALGCCFALVPGGGLRFPSEGTAETSRPRLCLEVDAMPLLIGQALPIITTPNGPL
jgi:hypothetical protein